MKLFRYLTLAILLALAMPACTTDEPIDNNGTTNEGGNNNQGNGDDNGNGNGNGDGGFVLDENK